MLSLHPSTAAAADVQLLFESSFPLAERRDWEPQLQFLDEGRLKLSLLQKDGTFIGFLFYWPLDGFTYIEHFAILESARGAGIGSEVMALFCDTFHAIVLEVELPDTKDAERRLRFYERAGFQAFPYPYHQPPYRQGERPIDMLLLYKNMGDGHEVFRRVRSELHTRVYICRPYES
ncbi:GNAT family N-acetyltransferase [Chitinophaga horti]|uniref:GNAT family N-acetyltransferase n=1 Tax=Chitinophaga horti TaxID=2920382 RepID=A0ABY6IXJ6_9BACT|nr:GNAT family N-acetyltransferase [Chitinophaga horti]UYQ92020.1 GNAT family N-acetyltransferase [Chitinophaga horti]